MVQRSKHRLKFLDRQLKSISEGKIFEIGEWQVRKPYRVNPNEFFCYVTIAQAFLHDPNYILAEVEVRGQGESEKGNISDPGHDLASVSKKLIEKMEEASSLNVAEVVEAIMPFEKREIDFSDGKEVWSEMRVTKIWNFKKDDFIELAIGLNSDCTTQLQAYTSGEEDEFAIVPAILCDAIRDKLQTGLDMEYIEKWLEKHKMQ